MHNVQLHKYAMPTVNNLLIGIQASQALPLVQTHISQTIQPLQSQSQAPLQQNIPQQQAVSLQTIQPQLVPQPAVQQAIPINYGR